MPRNVLTPVQIAKAQSLAANFVTPATTIKYTDNVCYQVNVSTVDSVGSFVVQVSLDYVPAGDLGGPSVAGNWANLSLSGTPAVNATNDTININLNQLPATAVRLSYISTTAGTGTCNVYIAAKGLA